MDDRKIRFRVGVVALFTFLVLAILIAMNTSAALSLGGGQYSVTIRTLQAPGVGRNTPVRRHGILIGRVDIAQTTDEGVMIVARIAKDQRVLASDLCQIRPSSLFGDAVIEFTQVPGGARAPLEPGSSIQGQAAADPLAALTELQVEIGPSIQSLGQAGEAVTQLASKVNLALGDELSEQRVAQVFDKLSLAIDNFTTTMDQMNRTMGSIEQLVGDEQTQGDIKMAIADVPELVSDIRRIATRLQGSIETFDSLVTTVERNFANIEELTKPLGDRGAELVELLLTSFENLDLVIADARRFSRSLSESQGTIGKLVNDPALYNNVNTTVYNANQVLGRINDLAKQIRPILNDVRVITDKVAREPGRVVTGGLFNRNPGVK